MVLPEQRKLSTIPLMRFPHKNSDLQEIPADRLVSFTASSNFHRALLLPDFISRTETNYPVSGYRVARMVADGTVDGGVLICGTGVGISLGYA